MIIEVHTPGTHIGLFRGFIEVNERRLPLEDVRALILATPAITITGQAMLALGRLGVLITLCDGNYLPYSLVQPFSNHNIATRRLHLQTRLTEARKRRMWWQLVRAKIRNQGFLLRLRGRSEGQYLEALATRLSVEDATLAEAQAARRYWRALFGGEFRRHTRGGVGVNAALNWGYAVLRSCIARHIVQVGLHPALGLQHHNRYNPLCLADDLMEPYRPLIDQAVAGLKCTEALQAQHKEALVAALDGPVLLEGRVYRMDHAARETATSLAMAVAEGKGQLRIPAATGRDG